MAKKRTALFALLFAALLLLSACAAQQQEVQTSQEPAYDSSDALPAGTQRLLLLEVETSNGVLSAQVQACDAAGNPLGDGRYHFALSNDFSAKLAPPLGENAQAQSVYGPQSIARYCETQQEPPVCTYAFNPAGELQSLDDLYEPVIVRRSVEDHLEVNQGLSYSVSYDEDGTASFTPMTSFVAGKSTAIICRAIAPEEDAVLTMQTAEGDLTFSPDETLSQGCNLYFFIDGAQIPEGEATFRVRTKRYDYLRSAVFTRTRTIHAAFVLLQAEPAERKYDVVPDWEALTAYLNDVYPLADGAFTAEVLKPIDLSGYDLRNPATADRAYEFLAGLLYRGDYEYIFGFLPGPFLRDGVTYTGMSFDDGNICLLGTDDIGPLLAHELGHSFDLGDEYASGSFNMEVNPPPGGFAGRDYYNPSRKVHSEHFEIRSASEEIKFSSGALIPQRCVPFCVRLRTAIDPAGGFMGSYKSKSMKNAWVSPAEWEQLFQCLRAD